MNTDREIAVENVDTDTLRMTDSDHGTDDENDEGVEVNSSVVKSVSQMLNFWASRLSHQPPEMFSDQRIVFRYSKTHSTHSQSTTDSHAHADSHVEDSHADSHAHTLTHIQTHAHTDSHEDSQRSLQPSSDSNVKSISWQLDHSMRRPRIHPLFRPVFHKVIK